MEQGRAPKAHVQVLQSVRPEVELHLSFVFMRILEQVVPGGASPYHRSQIANASMQQGSAQEGHATLLHGQPNR